MTRDWLQHYLDDEEITAARVDVAWEGKHVVLLKRKRPVWWTVIDKEYAAFNSPAGKEAFEAGKPMLETELRIGRLSAPDFDRLVARVKELDAKYPALVAARDAAEAARNKRIREQKETARRQEREAKRRADALCGLLRKMGIPFNQTETRALSKALDISRIEVHLDNGVYLDLYSHLDRFVLSDIRLGLRNNLTDTELVAKIVAAISKLRLPKKAQER